jgi:hypothetical protein
MLKALVVDRNGNYGFPLLRPRETSQELFTLMLQASRYPETDFPKVVANNETVVPSEKTPVTNDYWLQDGQYTIQWTADLSTTVIVQSLAGDRRVHLRGLDGVDVTIGSGAAALPDPENIPTATP